MSTSVRHFTDAMEGAPAITGEAGKLIALDFTATYNAVAADRITPEVMT